VQGAAGGASADRERFAFLYQPVIRSYLGVRWRDTHLVKEIEDAVQEVFVECFKQGGALDRVKKGGGTGGFRAFLHAVANNVAARFERRRARRRERQEDTQVRLGDFEANETRLSEAFDRAWMIALLDQAVVVQEEHAHAKGEAAVRRVELLRLRFNEDLPIREIARKWDMPAAKLHHEYARAREEFSAALREVLAFHNPDDPKAVEREFLRLSEDLV